MTAASPRPSRAVVLGGVGVLIVLSILTALVFNGGGATSQSDLRLTEVNATLVAAGLATENVATRQSGVALVLTDTPEVEATLTDAPPSVTPTDLPSVSPSETATERPTETATATATQTPEPTMTATDTASPTASETATSTRTDTPEPTATETASETPTETMTPDLALLARATVDAEASATAALWTPTPTDDIPATIAAIAATNRSADQTATATQWTHTPTSTDTVTHTPTSTYTATHTFTPSLTPTLTLTRTPTATNTVMPTRTHSPSPTPSPDPLAAARAPVAANADWTPVTQNFDGVPMVLVPAGCFDMGSNAGDPDELPVNRQCFAEPFWIDQTEVTQGQFSANGGIKASTNAFTGDQRPVEQITWHEAANYCVRRGARLPTEAEWEYAARGPSNHIYPWGNTFVGANLVYIDNSGSQTANVGSKPGGASWVGAQDMAGNVWEWTSSLYQPFPYNETDGREADAGDRTDILRVLRGGAWNNNTGNLRSANRDRSLPVVRDNFHGFRCASSGGETILPAPTTTANIILTPLSPTPSPTPRPDLIALAHTPVTRNADWMPVMQEFDGVTMVLVPVGCFDMGSAAGDPDERPVHQQCFDAPFWIDQTEVTQAQFTANGGVKANPNRFSGNQRPVEQITWYEASAYCQQRGARLPTEAEWEYAARGPSNLIYPWGNTFIGTNLVWSENSSEQTANVGSHPAGVSWVGAQDMAGNVWEWASSLYEPYPHDATDGREQLWVTTTEARRVLRGGGWLNVESRFFRSAYRSWYPPDDLLFRLGLRCTRSSSVSSNSTPTLESRDCSNSEFAVGCQVDVNSDSARLRESPSTSVAVIRNLSRGETVVIIGGPVDQGGYTWWQVQGVNYQGWIAGINLSPLG